MKDYYKTLGVPEDASHDDIRNAFRRLAFKHHPDKNPGNEKEAEEKFKEINEAYAVLCDPDKRQQYDLYGNGAAGSGFGGFNQADIFRSSFANQATFADIAAMFRQAGLRFDDDFLNRTFFSGQNFVFHTYNYGGKTESQNATPDNTVPATAFGSGLSGKVARFIVRKIFGINLPEPPKNLDTEKEIRLKSKEAATGLEKEIKVKHDGAAKKLLVKIPAGIQSGTRIRLKGMGKQKNGRSGDMYVRIRVF